MACEVRRTVMFKIVAGGDNSAVPKPRRNVVFRAAHKIWKHRPRFLRWSGPRNVVVTNNIANVPDGKPVIYGSKGQREECLSMVNKNIVDLKLGESLELAGFLKLYAGYCVLRGFAGSNKTEVKDVESADSKFSGDYLAYRSEISSSKDTLESLPFLDWVRGQMPKDTTQAALKASAPAPARRSSDLKREIPEHRIRSATPVAMAFFETDRDGVDMDATAYFLELLSKDTPTGTPNTSFDSGGGVETKPISSGDDLRNFFDEEDDELCELMGGGDAGAAASASNSVASENPDLLSLRDGSEQVSSVSSTSWKGVTLLDPAHGSTTVDALSSSSDDDSDSDLSDDDLKDPAGANSNLGGSAAGHSWNGGSLPGGTADVPGVDASGLWLDDVPSDSDSGSSDDELSELMGGDNAGVDPVLLAAGLNDTDAYHDVLNLSISSEVSV